MFDKKIVALVCFFISLIVVQYFVAAEPVPEWLNQKMKEQNNGIKEFKKFETMHYEGKNFYIVYSAWEDRIDPVFDESGNKICSLGGFGDIGDGKCPGFIKNRKNIFGF